MTRRGSLLITVMLSIAATALMIGLAVAHAGSTTAGVPLAGIALNAID